MATVLEIKNAIIDRKIGKAINYSRLAAIVALLFMALAIVFSQMSLSSAQADRKKILSEVALLKTELQEVKHHCEMDRKALRDQIAALKTSHK